MIFAPVLKIARLQHTWYAVAELFYFSFFIEPHLPSNAAINASSALELFNLWIYS